MKKNHLSAKNTQKFKKTYEYKYIEVKQWLK